MEIHVRERCKGQDWLHAYPFANCEDCTGTGYIESWVQVSFTAEDLRMGRLMGESPAGQESAGREGQLKVEEVQ